MRLVYDDGGSFMTPSSFFKPLVEAGGIVVKHYPAKLKIFTLNWNYRNHRKIVVIDGVIGYMGGMNIGDEYCSLNPKYSPWRDAHFKVEGEAVALLQMRFLKDYLDHNIYFKTSYLEQNLVRAKTQICLCKQILMQKEI